MRDSEEGRPRQPPQRVMQERAQRDLRYQARKQEDDVKKVGEEKRKYMETVESNLRKQQFEQEEMRRATRDVDPSSLETLRQLQGMTSTTPTINPIPSHPIPSVSWKSPVPKSNSSAHPLPAVARSAPLDATETTNFLKAIGVWEHSYRRKEGAARSPRRNDTPLEDSVSRRRSPSRQAPHSDLVAPASSLSPPPPHSQNRLQAARHQDHSPHVSAISTEMVIDHTRAPERTMVGHMATIRKVMKSKPLAPIPTHPVLVDTTVPKGAGSINTEALLAKFKLQAADERDYVVDKRSREIAEDSGGTLLHFEMTSSIKRVEGILAALERGKEYRDMVAYKDAKEWRHDDASQQEREGTSIEELRQVIQILLKDGAKQASALQDVELAYRKTTLELRDTQDEVAKRSNAILSLQQQIDGLVTEREALKREHSQLESKVERLLESSKQLSEMLQEREEAHNDEGNSTCGADEVAQQNPGGGELPMSRDSKRALDARMLLQGLTGPAVPSKEAIPQGDDVAIVCTAVQSISQLWETCGQDMPTAIALHNRIIQDEIPKHRGYQVKTAGEEFLVAFHSVIDAVNFAVAVQEVLVEQVWPQRLASEKCCAVVPKEEVLVPENSTGEAHPARDSDMTPQLGDLWRGLRVAMGIHCGPVHVELNPATNGYDYMGSTVNKALLLKRVSHGGMAAVSKNVYERLHEAIDALDDTSQFHLPVGQKASHSVLNAEGTRRTSPPIAASKHPTMPKQLRPITAAFHCKIPAARGGAAADVYCVLPVSLEDRLSDIQAANKAMAEASGISIDDVLRPATESEQPSELETMLGTFSRGSGPTAMLLTGSGVEQMSTLTEEETEHLAIQHAGLPSGTVTLVAIQCDVVRNKKFAEKILAKDMEQLLKSFHDCIELAASPFAAKIVEHRQDIHTLAFSNIGVAVRCALAIDAELTTFMWPKWIDNYKELEEVRWNRGARIFAGPRPQMGIHMAQLQPHYDPMTKAVGYIGFDAFVAYKLACTAKPGQILLDESNAYHALAVVRPMPFYSHLTPNASAAPNSSVSSRLCVVLSRSHVGRHFFWAGVDRYETWKSPSYRTQYRRMMSDLEVEDLRWRRDATRVVAREHLSSGITAPLVDPNAAKKKEGDEEDDEEDGTGAESAELLGLGKKFDAVVQKAAGTMTHATEMRKRDCEIIHIFCRTLLSKLDSEGLSEMLRDRDPAIGQLEKLEHNMMVLHDTFYEGQLVAFQPLIADIADLRDLPLQGTSRDAPQVGNSGGDAESAPSTGRKKSVAEEWTDADDDGEDDGEKDPDEEPLDIEAVHSLSASALSALKQESGGKPMSDDEVRKRLIILEEEVLLAHRIVRNMLLVLKEWMEPLLNSNSRYIMPDDEVVSKLISVDRSAREPYIKKHPATASAPPSGGPPSSATSGATAAPTAIASAVPKTTRQMWRHIIEHAVMDTNVEERMRGRGGKLLRSLESLVCRHFLFLRQYVKRVRMKERNVGRER